MPHYNILHCSREKNRDKDVSSWGRPLRSRHTSELTCGQGSPAALASRYMSVPIIYDARASSCYPLHVCFQTQAVIPPDVESWRSQLLLQVLRETGEEMRRRRQTLKEVLARHAAEGGSSTCIGRGEKGSLQPALSG